MDGGGGGGIINSIKTMDAGQLMRMQQEGLRMLRDEKRVTVTDSRKKDSRTHTHKHASIMFYIDSAV